MEQEYLSVRQFAKRAGVTTQRIYQMMNKSLKSYCKVENGKKYISADGLKIFEKAEMEKKTACQGLQVIYQDQNLGLATLKTLLIMPISRKKTMKIQKKLCKGLQRTYQDQILGIATH